MAQDVVKSFLKNEKHFATENRSYVNLTFISIDRERNRKLDTSRYVLDMAAHPAGKVGKAIMFGINSPDNIADRIDDFARNGADLFQRSNKLVCWIGLLDREFTPYRDGRQTGANVIVQVCRNAETQTFTFQSSGHAVAIQSINSNPNHDRHGNLEPSGHPEWRKNVEHHGCRRL